MTATFTLPIRVDIGSADPSRHLTHHNHLLLFQEARKAYLNQFGYTERNIEGLGMFVVEVNCRYKKELFHQDDVVVTCRVDEIRSRVFSMSYTIEKNGQICAQGYTKNVCVDTVTRKSVPLPAAFVEAVRRYEGLDALH